ncbi:recombinase family protein [Thalassobaculum sp. OXR-137]|uniref:recombinase family protein n=1 Tax=Thalassobaculum sp. OXR-137 TaxID=3100173 RepID=UPI002AC8CE76|nr:recombinase family protein [Thalassobaculum sp. OXR-137]WPZ35531.1 recombinase family protein [Thalassobaculum sp. OXR-137]
MTSPQPRAYSYVRFSRPEQLRGDSLRRQLDASREYAEKHGLELDDSLRDLGVSAYRGVHRERGALGAFLDLVEAGKVPRGSILIVESLDRLSRQNVFDALDQFSGLIRAGIEIVTLADHQRYSRESIVKNWSQLLISIGVMARAHEESQMKSDRLGSVWRKKKELAAEGSIVTSRAPAWLRVVDGKFQPIPERAAVVRRIFQEAADGVGAYSITARLNREGVQPFGRSRGWQQSYVTKILNNPAVTGTYQPHSKRSGKRVPEGAPVLDYFPAVVDEALFWRARAAARERNVRPGRGAGRRGKNFANLFSGLAKCECGGTMIYLDKGNSAKSGGPYLTCDSRQRGLGCGHARHWKYASTERSILTALRRVDWSRVVTTNDANAAAELAQRVEGLRAQIADTEDGRKEWAVLVEKKVQFAIDRVLELTDTLDRLDSELKAAEEEWRAATATAADARERVDLVAEMWRQQEELEGEDRYRLRARINQELRRVLERLEFGDSDVLALYRRRKRPRAAMVDYGAFGFSLLKGEGRILKASADDIAAVEYAEWLEQQEAAKSNSL